jgi:hypothetical protein
LTILEEKKSLSFKIPEAKSQKREKKKTLGEPLESAQFFIT